MSSSTVHREFGAMGVLMVLSSAVPLVTTLLLSEWIVIERAFLVGFVPFLLNGALGLVIMLWVHVTTKRTTSGNRFNRVG